ARDRSAPRAPGAGGAGDAPAPGGILGTDLPAFGADAGRAGLDSLESLAGPLSLGLVGEDELGEHELAGEHELPALDQPALLQAQEIDAGRKFLPTGVATIP